MGCGRFRQASPSPTGAAIMAPRNHRSRETAARQRHRRRKSARNRSGTRSERLKRTLESGRERGPPMGQAIPPNSQVSRTEGRIGPLREFRSRVRFAGGRGWSPCSLDDCRRFIDGDCETFVGAEP